MFFNTIHQKKSAVITTLFTMLVLFLLFFCGLNEVSEPQEYGVAINYGTSDVGSGEPKINETIKTSPEESTPPLVEETIADKQTVNEELLTEDIEDVPVIENKKTPVKKVEKAVPEKVIEKKPVKEVAKKKTSPNKETQNALNNLFGKKSEGKSSKSEGDDVGKEGVKGALDGNSKSSKYYGNNGSGGDSNYLLKGRRALSKPIRKPKCNEEGTVAVSVEVDKNGKVTKAVPGVKGTTNNSPCLLAPAKQAALKTTWNADANAPNRQVGVIRYKFTLSE